MTQYLLRPPGLDTRPPTQPCPQDQASPAHTHLLDVHLNDRDGVGQLLSHPIGRCVVLVVGVVAYGWTIGAAGHGHGRRATAPYAAESAADACGLGSRSGCQSTIGTSPGSSSSSPCKNPETSTWVRARNGPW